MDRLEEDLTRITEAYNRRACEYATALGDIRTTSPVDQDRIRQWATHTGGTLCVLGAGPGHWTQFLHQIGASATGLDPSEKFVAIAAQRFPHLNFICGTARDLPTSTFDGILAWYSLIHVNPDELDEELSYIGRALTPGGSLLMGFFIGEDVEPFGHAITPAWFHPMHLMGKRLEQAGFALKSWNTRCDDGARAHGDIEAVFLN